MLTINSHSVEVSITGSVEEIVRGPNPTSFVFLFFFFFFIIL